MSDKPRIFDPECEYQKEELLSGRWTTTTDELRQLYEAVGGVSQEAYDELLEEAKSREDACESNPVYISFPNEPAFQGLLPHHLIEKRQQLRRAA